MSYPFNFPYTFSLTHISFHITHTYLFTTPHTYILHLSYTYKYTPLTTFSLSKPTHQKRIRISLLKHINHTYSFIFLILSSKASKIFHFFLTKIKPNHILSPFYLLLFIFLFFISYSLHLSTLTNFKQDYHHGKNKRIFIQKTPH